MPLTPQDLHAIQAAVAPVIGREAWGVHLGYGGRLTLCFGQDRSATRTLRSGQQWVETRGEWILWTDSVMWRLEDTDSYGALQWSQRVARLRKGGARGG